MHVSATNCAVAWVKELLQGSGFKIPAACSETHESESWCYRLAMQLGPALKQRQDVLKNGFSGATLNPPGSDNGACPRNLFKTPNVFSFF